jgi:hypothetical protein
MKTTHIAFIKVDTNDADYVTTELEIDEKQVQLLKEIAEALKKNKSDHNWPAFEGDDTTPEEQYKDILKPEHFSMMEEIQGGECGFHTVDSIIIFPKKAKITLF